MLRKTLYMLSILSIASTAFASGYQISEYSATNLGRAFAGAGLVGDDFSALGYNPAGMSINNKSGIQGGAAGILLHSDYKDNATGEKHSSKMGRVLPHFFTQYKLNDQWTVGAGIYTPYGLITDYRNGWFGKQHGILSELKAVDFSPSVAYKPHEMITFGAALNVQYADARLTGSGYSNSLSVHGFGSSEYTTDLKGHDTTSLGYSLGVVLTPRKDLRLGVSYRSEVDHKIKGNIKFDFDNAAYSAMLNGKHNISAKITTPELVLISGAYDVNEKLTLSASARWTRWTRFKNLDIIAEEAMLGGVRQPGMAISQTHENWKNTWFYSIGADYKINDNWTVRLGTAYDETVIKAPEYRTVRVPDGRRIFASVGLSYMTGNWQYDLGYTHVWMRAGDAKGGETGKEPANVHYNHSGAYIGGFSVQYKF